MTTEGAARLGASRKLQEAFGRAWPCLCSMMVVNCGFRDTTGIWTSEQVDLGSQRVSLCRPLGPRLAFSVHWRM